MGKLPADLPATVFVVLHISPQSPSMLPTILNRSSSLAATHPTDGTHIKHRHIYVAPPDHHMILEKDHIRIVRGPKENRHRPAVDTLFRSAASVYGPRVVGVILTGSLDDGTAGLLAVKRQGGIAVVQDPKDAIYPSMPQSAIEHVKIDSILPLADIASMLVTLVDTEVDTTMEHPVPEDMQNELSLAKMELPRQKDDIRVGTPSQYSCPECGGVLWEIQDQGLLRFRCRVGHAYSVDSMMEEQSDSIEEAMWAALKTLEEQVSISRKMAEQARQNGRISLAKRFEDRQKQAEKRVDLLVAVLRKSETEIPLEEDV
jgi:two-component system chemotaxis response regulator CheB